MRIGARVPNVVVTRKTHCVADYPTQFAACLHVAVIVNLDHMFCGVELYNCFKNITYGAREFSPSFVQQVQVNTVKSKIVKKSKFILRLSGRLSSLIIEIVVYCQALRSVHRCYSSMM